MILDMDVEDGIGIINKAYEKKEEERAFQLYTARYPWMGEKDFVPFSEFYKPRKNNEHKNQHESEEEILTNVKSILDSYKF